MIDSLILIGRTQGMESIVSSALQLARNTRVFQSLAAAFDENLTADLLLILQHWPDEYSPEEIRRLLEQFRLTRIIVCQSPWCVSDRRNRQYWPAAVCVPVSAAQRRIDRELEVFSGQRPPLPWTAGLDEIFCFDHG